MTETETLSYTAFAGSELIAQGALEEVILKTAKKIRKPETSAILIFNDSTGKVMDFDLRGSEKEILKRLQVYVPTSADTSPSGPGRPKLGVVTREISLLPRHWEWLATQSGGASASLRRLIEDAKRSSLGKNQVKQAQERTHKFMSALAGDLPHYEEALRALYKRDENRFNEQIESWPRDVREYAKELARSAFRNP